MACESLERLEEDRSKRVESLVKKLRYRNRRLAGHKSKRQGGEDFRRGDSGKIKRES
jgi:mRNA-degrading endonuclease RelE of RelBE toxin-antitoxin system